MGNPRQERQPRRQVPASMELFPNPSPGRVDPHEPRHNSKPDATTPTVREPTEGFRFPAPTADAVVPSSQSPTQSLPRWCRLLLARVQSGIDLEHARLMDGSKVSQTLVHQAMQQYPGFRELLMQEDVGALLEQPITERDHARALAHTVIDDAYNESRPTAQGIAPRDRVTNRRLVFETAGAIGGQAQVSVTLPVQVNVYQGGYEQMLADHEPPPKPVQARVVPPKEQV